MYEVEKRVAYESHPIVSAVGPNKRADRNERAAESASQGHSYQSEGIADAIALLATGLRILLKIELQDETQAECQRSIEMVTEAPELNGNDRYDVLVVEKYEDDEGLEKASWTKVGVGFAHKDGLGLNIELKALPVNGKLVIRRHEAKRSRDA
jgi:hypothetical protein